MPDSDIRVYIGELRASQKSMEEASRQAAEDNRQVANELSGVAKELHGVVKILTGQTVRVDKLEASELDHEKRIRVVEDYATADKPFKEMRTWGLRAIIMAASLAAFWAVFQIK